MDSLDLLGLALLHRFQQTPHRPVLLRPRPSYLPHPCRRLPRLRGVIAAPHRKVYC